MASLRVHFDRLEIQLTPAEKALSLRRDDIAVSRESIRSVTITDDPWIWIRGIRAPGALVPLVLAIGTWKSHGGKDFLVIKNRRQAVIIDIADSEYSRVIVSTNHAAELIDALNVNSERIRADGELQQAVTVGKAAAVRPRRVPAAKTAAVPAAEPTGAEKAAAAKPAAARAAAAKTAAAKTARETAAAKTAAEKTAADKTPAAKTARKAAATKAAVTRAATKPAATKTAGAPRAPKAAKPAAGDSPL